MAERQACNESDGGDVVGRAGRPPRPKVEDCVDCGAVPRETRWRKGRWQVKGSRCTACRRAGEKGVVSAVAHGSYRRYVEGCRCRTCVSAQAERETMRWLSLSSGRRFFAEGDKASLVGEYYADEDRLRRRGMLRREALRPEQLLRWRRALAAKGVAVVSVEEVVLGCGQRGHFVDCLCDLGGEARERSSAEEDEEAPRPTRTTRARIVEASREEGKRRRCGNRFMVDGLPGPARLACGCQACDVRRAFEQGQVPFGK